jgi:hypothetical protein
MSRYAIGGAMGATFYVEPLLTFDLDIIVLLPQMNSGLLTLAPLYEALRAKGYMEEEECVLIEGVPVQFLPAYGVQCAVGGSLARGPRYVLSGNVRQDVASGLHDSALNRSLLGRNAR